MKFVKERVNVICQELARLSISQKIKITDMQVKNGCYITPAEADASKEPWTSFDTVNDRWYGPDKHYWFRTTITIPESFDGKNLWMRVHAGLDDWDDGRNPQFLLFANGEVIQGMDIHPPHSPTGRHPTPPTNPQENTPTPVKKSSLTCSPTPERCTASSV